MSDAVLLAKVVHRQTASLDNALECADGDRFAAVHRYDHLAAVRMPPFLVASLLADHDEAVFLQDLDNFSSGANREAFAHVNATSSTFAPGENETGDGSNQSSNASFALPIASASVSPADAQPGSSGKKAAHRPVSGSCSTTNLSFMLCRIATSLPAGKAPVLYP